MTVPGWYALLLLAGGAYRTWRLLALDAILDRPRAWIAGVNGDADDYREALDTFLQCPWCSGFWIALAWWAAWQAWPHATLVAAAAAGVSTLVGLVARLDDREN